MIIDGAVPPSLYIPTEPVFILSAIVISPVYVTFPFPSLTIPILVFVPIVIFPVTTEFSPLAYTPIEFLSLRVIVPIDKLIFPFPSP